MLGGHSPLMMALQHMKAALELIDQINEAPDVGAHLDLAICRLQESLDRPHQREIVTGTISVLRNH